MGHATKLLLDFTQSLIFIACKKSSIPSMSCSIPYTHLLCEEKMHSLEKKSRFAKIGEYDIHSLHRVEGSRQKLETPIVPPKKKKCLEREKLQNSYLATRWHHLDH